MLRKNENLAAFKKSDGFSKGLSARLDFGGGGPAAGNILGHRYLFRFFLNGQFSLHEAEIRKGKQCPSIFVSPVDIFKGNLSEILIYSLVRFWASEGGKRSLPSELVIRHAQAQSRSSGKESWLGIAIRGQDVSIQATIWEMLVSVWLIY